jgi:hypothetical protein
MIHFELKPRAFSTVLESLSRETGKTVSEVLRAQARLLAVDLAFRTQPYGKTKGKGEGAIRKDLVGRKGLLNVVSDEIAANAKRYSTGNVRLFIGKDGKVYWTTADKFIPNARPQQIRPEHKAAFKNGKLRAPARQSQKGNFVSIAKLTVKKSAAEKYVQTQQKKIGWAKSGWAACANQLGGTRGIPRWVTKHKGQTGTVEDNSSRKDNPSVTIENTIDYVEKILPQSQINEAENRVKVNMEKQLSKILRAKK